MTDPASTAVIAICVAIMVGAYPIAVWRKVRFTTVTVIANVVIFLIYILPRSFDIYRDVVETLGFSNQDLRTAQDLYTLYTYMYIHADFLHVFFNMFIFYLFGVHFEERVGFKWMAITYWTTGILGAGVLNGVVTIDQPSIGIGASGAISGVLGAFAIMYPWDRVPMVIIFIILPRVQVAFGALVFILFQTFMMFFAVSLPGSLGNVSYSGHLAGVVVGVVMGYLMARAGVEAPTPGARLGRKLDVMDYEMLRPLAIKRTDQERLDALIAEDIPEVKEVLLEDLVSRLRCPECSSIMTLKGTTLRCEGCEWRLDLRRKG